MSVGDLVRRWGTDDPRIGVIQETFKANGVRGEVCCLVFWHNGDKGHYFDTSLEVI